MRTWKSKHAWLPSSITKCLIGHHLRWVSCTTPEHIWALTGCSEDEYWSDPFYWGLQAEHVLGSDGVITIFVPIARGAYRCVDGQVLEAAYTGRIGVGWIAAMPDPEEVAATFDEEAAYTKFVAELKAEQAQCGDLLSCVRRDWRLIPKALWYHEYGYETALTTLALYPDGSRKLIQLAGGYTTANMRFCGPVLLRQASTRGRF